MLRRDFIRAPVAIIMAGAFAACTGTAPLVTASDVDSRHDAIDTGFYATLERVYAAVPDAREIVGKARGILVFPTVIATGVESHEQSGDGVLRVANTMTGYYSLVSSSIGSIGSIGLGTGTQSKALIYLFMTQDTLDKFRNSTDWTVGKDAVTILKPGTGGRIDALSANGAILVLVLTPDGAFASPDLGGTKITPLAL